MLAHCVVPDDPCSRPATTSGWRSLPSGWFRIVCAHDPEPRVILPAVRALVALHNAHMMRIGTVERGTACDRPRAVPHRAPMEQLPRRPGNGAILIALRALQRSDDPRHPLGIAWEHIGPATGLTLRAMQTGMDALLPKDAIPGTDRLPGGIADLTFL